MAERIPGVVDAAQIYRLDEFRLRMGLGDLAFREVKRRGLKVVKVGKRIYVRGRDWLEFVDREAEKQAADQTEQPAAAAQL